MNHRAPNLFKLLTIHILIKYIQYKVYHLFDTNFGGSIRRYSSFCITRTERENYHQNRNVLKSILEIISLENNYVNCPNSIFPLPLKASPYASLLLFQSTKTVSLWPITRLPKTLWALDSPFLATSNTNLYYCSTLFQWLFPTCSVPVRESLVFLTSLAQSVWTTTTELLLVISLTTHPPVLNPSDFFMEPGKLASLALAVYIVQPSSRDYFDQRPKADSHCLSFRTLHHTDWLFKRNPQATRTSLPVFLSNLTLLNMTYLQLSTSRSFPLPPLARNVLYVVLSFPWNCPRSLGLLSLTLFLWHFITHSLLGIDFSTNFCTTNNVCNTCSLKCRD